MRKHSARSVPDRVEKSFDISNIYFEKSYFGEYRYNELPGFSEWRRRFWNKMKAKHGHNPEIEVVSYINQSWNLEDRGCTVILKYRGVEKSFAERQIEYFQSLWLSQERILADLETPKSIRERFKFFSG